MKASSCFHATSCLPEEDRTLISRLGQGPTVPVPYHLIHEAFENIAEAHPATIAATVAGNSITYHQLNEAANRLANYLIHAGLKPRQRVCLIVQRSFEMLVGIFAILKAGCQYVPVDGGVASSQVSGKNQAICSKGCHCFRSERGCWRIFPSDTPISPSFTAGRCIRHIYIR
jgi:non-ribosomal peptide synthetase component F